MEALNAQELDDSIFGTDQTLDWAEEADTMQGLSVDPFPSSLSTPGIRKESDDAAAAAGSARGPSRHSTGEYGNNNNSRGSRDTRDTRDFRGRNQQNNNGRQSRQDGRTSRNHADVNGGYGGGRGDRGGDRGDRGDRGGSKNRGGRSTSRTGYSGSQQGYPHGPSASASGGQNMGDGRPPRRSRDRSLSMERSGSIDRPRVWRGTTAGSRSRADKVDRWEHDKFDNGGGGGGGAGGQYQTGSRSRGRVRRGSIVQDSGPSPIDIEHIGKEGISHVTINRRGSNASSRNYMGTSYETPRRLGPDHSFDDRAGSEMHRFAKNQHSAAPAQSSLSPRSPVNNSNSAIHEPYRAPHRRKSSVDRSILPDQPSATVTSPLANPAASIATDAPQQQQSHQKKDIKDSEEDEGSSAEMEWENFVANGGLEMPLDRITDDLLRHPRRESTSKQTSPDTGTAQRLSSSDKASHNDYAHTAASSLAHASAKQDKRPTLLLDDDDDTSDSAMGQPNSSGSDVDRAGGKRGSKDGSQGISIRGATKSTVKPDSRVTQPATEKAAASTSRAKNSGNGPTPERNLRNAGSAALQASQQQQQQQQNVSGSDSLGIRIKGTSASNGQLKTADIRTPSAPIRPAANTSRPSSPSKPDPASAGRSSSRSSSTEGRAKTISTPNTYLRRQFEGYDEDRGRHIFSVNIAYDENRHAPIHVHEKDDVVKLAAKFARTWRVYNKEQRIKQLLIKMKNLTQEAAL